ncbi:TPA: hypothetical protein ACH3X2_013222 [Trebouxia sp. C0005]
MRVVRWLPNQCLLAVVVSAALLQPGLSDKLFQTADKLAVKYVIGIERDGNIAENEEESGFGQHIRMTNSTGHAFDCLLPLPSGDAYLDTADNKGDTQQQELTSEQVLSTLSKPRLKMHAGPVHLSVVGLHMCFLLKMSSTEALSCLDNSVRYQQVRAVSTVWKIGGHMSCAMRSMFASSIEKRRS